MECGSHPRIQYRRSVFGAKDDMHENTGQRLRQDGATINRGYILGTVKVVGCISQNRGCEGWIGHFSPYFYADSYPGRCRISCFAGNPALAWAGIASRLRRLVLWRATGHCTSIVRLTLMGRESWERCKKRSESR